ncbi:MAG: iron ABC transporter permease [Dehalococcoidia bacterium]|nr:MAG: iron ABC transporter permease [Dehalococcoidia bacterium]
MRAVRSNFLNAPIAAGGAILVLLAVIAWPLAALAQAVDPQDVFAIVDRDVEFRRAFLWGAAQAATSCAIGAACGLASAYCWTRLHYPGRTVLRGLAIAPLAVPPVALAVGIEALFAAGTPASDVISFFGVAPEYLRSGTGAVILAHGLSATAIVGWFASVAWTSVDGQKVEAARTLGASRIRAARATVWPVVRPAAAAGAGLAFIQSFLSYGVVVILGAGRETPEGLSIRLALAGDQRALSVVVLTAAAALVFGLVTVQFLRMPRADPGHGRLQRRPRTPERAVMLIAALPALLVVSIVLALLLRAVSDRGLSLWHVRSLVDGPGSREVRRAALGSVLAALPAAALTALWGSMAGAAWGRMRGVSGMLRATALLFPVALSPAALAYGWLLVRPELDPRAVLPLVQAAAAFPLVAGTVARMRPRARPDTTAAARSLGASPLRAWRALHGRAYAVAMASGFFIAFGRAFAETSAAAMARMPGGTLPLRLLELDRQGTAGPAAALAGAILLICVVAFLLGDPIIARLGRARR